MEKNIAIIIISVAAVLVLALGWWFFTKTNSVDIQDPGSTAVLNTASIIQSSEKLITSFTFSGIDPQPVGTVDNEKSKIIFIVPSDVDITSLSPIISVSPKATVSPSSGSFKDFTNPVTFTVTAEDGSTKIYTIIVNTTAPQGPVIGS